MPFLIVAFLLASAIGAGASFAAQNALPGDPLWTFKTDINEKVAEALAPEGKMRAEFHIAAIDTREKDATLLNASKPLSADVQTHIEENIATHVHGAEAQIALLQSKGDYAAAADEAAQLQAVLAKQTSGLLTLGAWLDEASALSADASAKAKQ